MDILKKLKQKQQTQKAEKKKRMNKRVVTPEKVALINPNNIKEYERYLEISISQNPDVRESTYKVYKSYFYIFLVYLLEHQENIDVLSEDFFDNTVDIMDGFIIYCQSELGNNKKAINVKISAVSSFFLWKVKRGEIKYNPLQDRVSRMKNASQEQIIDQFFLTDEEIDKITNTLYEEYKKPVKERKYDIQDLLIWLIALESAARVGALSRLTLSSLNYEEAMFEDIREKGGKKTEIIFELNTRDVLVEWLEMRENDYDMLECDSAFIINHHNEWKPMSTGAIYKRVQKIGKILGLETFRPHGIRKSAINKLVRDTGDINMAKELANHNSIETTQIYVKPKSKAEIRQQLKEKRESKK